MRFGTEARAKERSQAGDLLLNSVFSFGYAPNRRVAPVPHCPGAPLFVRPGIFIGFCAAQEIVFGRVQSLNGILEDLRLQHRAYTPGLPGRIESGLIAE